jgi:hypothetical protein
LLAAGGCTLPKFPLFEFLTPGEEQYQLRTIDGIDLDKESTSPPVNLDEAAAKTGTPGALPPGEELPPPDPNLLPGALDKSSANGKQKDTPVPIADRLDLTLADARASALSANLELQIEQVNPAIARQVISQEEGQFEATFSSTYVRNRVDPPPGVLAGGQPDTTFDQFTNAVTQPLIGGGEFRALHDFTKTDIHGLPVFNSVDTDLGVEYRQPLLRGFGYQVNTANIQIARAQTGIADAQAKLTAIRLLACWPTWNERTGDCTRPASFTRSRCNNWSWPSGNTRA